MATPRRIRVKLRYLAALYIVVWTLSVPVFPTLLGESHVIYYVGGGLGVGLIQAVTLYLIRLKTPYEW